MAVPIVDAVRLAERSRKALEKHDVDKKNGNDNNCMVVVDFIGGNAKKTSLYKDHMRKLARSEAPDPPRGNKQQK